LSDTVSEVAPIAPVFAQESILPVVAKLKKSVAGTAQAGLNAAKTMEAQLPSKNVLAKRR
jgi:hypothetical protein